jgi:2-polyprenyl-6-hydroxyphenyl methylase/3-demethylubiquinone-9 3-methyltransferase
MLGSPREGKPFADVGSASGFSVWRRLGARVHSLDYDTKSVACTMELRRGYSADNPLWTIEQASAPDQRCLSSLGNLTSIRGGLHPTGAMWPTLENVARLVAEGRKFLMAIDNNQQRSQHVP